LITPLQQLARCLVLRPNVRLSGGEVVVGGAFDRGAVPCLRFRLRIVPTESTTIRVSVQTRDRLATQARERGISVSALLDELATRAENDAIFCAEREATRMHEASKAARGEREDWDTTVADGVV
jgi:post-segregation antitoxin (ccd killing protein)